MNKRKYKIICLIIIIFLFTYFQTMVYSAFSLTMNLNGTAVAKAQKNAIITDFHLSNAIDAESFYEEFNKNTISTYARMFSDESSILYFVEVTNYGDSEVGISDITGLPSNLTYELIGYSLGESICDDDNKCTSNVTKTFLIEIIGNIPGDYEFTLEFHFKTYYKIKYTNIYTYNSYPKKIASGEDLNITFKDDLDKVSIISNGNVLNYYEEILEGQTIKIENPSNNIEIKSSKELNAQITNFWIQDSSEGSSLSEDFGVNTLSLYTRMFSEESSILYFVEVTNYGDSEVGISDITGLPSNLRYELTDYSLGESICNDDKCTSNVTKRFLIEIIGNIPGDYEFTLEFHFETYHKITYTNIYTYNSYPKKIANGEELNVTFKEKVEKVSIISNGNILNYYEEILAGQTIKIENPSNDIEIKSENPLTVRITNFKSSSDSLGFIWNENFSANSISSTIRLLSGNTPSVKIDIEVTVFDESEFEISNIIASNLHKNLSYKLINYSLGDKICDSTGKCISNAVKTFQIEITGAPGDYEISFDFEFNKIS